MKWLTQYFDFSDNIVIQGLTDELGVFYVAEKYKNSSNNLLVVTNTLLEANNLYEKISTYVKANLFPMDEFISKKIDASSPELELKRLETLKAISANDKKIIITNVTGFLKKLPELNSTTTNIILNKTTSVDRKMLIENLIEYGYKVESLVTNTGELAIRGFILDIFPNEFEHPIRIEFNGNRVEAIRTFDENTQMSINKLDMINIYPVKEIKTIKNSSLIDYLDNPCVIFFDYDQLILNINKIEEELLTENLNKDFYFSKDLIINKKVCIDFSDNVYKNLNNKKYISETTQKFNNNYEYLNKYVAKQIKTNKTVIFALSTDQEVKEILKIFPNVNLNQIKEKEINIMKAKINEGFIFNNFVCISEFDLTSTYSKKINYYNSYRIGKKIKGFDSLKAGDYIVHTIYGIGIYNGVTPLTKNGFTKDYIQLIYKDNDKVYLPVEKIESLYKYNSNEGTAPRLSKLGTTTWEKTKLATKKKITDLTIELVKLYAERLTMTHEPYKNYPEISMFDSEFQYTETYDQSKAIDDVYKDLASNICMDRLLCGDVGFGKTEVAFRAAFKTIINGYQVAYLCPTTILSKQQYNNAVTRFKNHPINIKLLNRFTTTHEKRKILEELQEGKVDMIIGTHRLLSSDVEFKNIGLLIVDEEQRFGVSHKEKIKKLKKNINILTLSATPIPRTLKFAMSGLRDMSIIDTPPVNRYPVQTYVINEDNSLIKDAIYKELSRKGQVYILYNNVEGIEEKTFELRKLCPLASFEYAHGQMRKEELDSKMNDFVENKFQVLVCTTIIETGIDISNVNTLIIFNADRFGLSQLYQLRGRVGRGDKLAFAYLLYNKNKMLNDIAIKRLKAIKEFTELGSGYKIAMRDLALRGAGDLLGGEQAGFIASVGIDLYMKMLEEEVNRQKGITISEENFENENLIDVTTHISDDYVDDESLKIEIHQLINSISNKKELINVKLELEDRFGHLNENLVIYMYEQLFERLATQKGIKKVEKTDQYVRFNFDENISSQIKGDKLLLLINNLSQKFKVYFKKNKIYIELYYKNLEKHFIFYLVDLLSGLF